MAHYSKTYSSPSQLVSLLQSRGLFIENATRTENYLHHIGYYRFSAYLYPLLTTPKENHVFKPGATFNQALDMYRFDRHLRLLMFNEIEKIEIAVRSAIVNITSRETGNPFWMTDPTCSSPLPVTIAVIMPACGIAHLHCKCSLSGEWPNLGLRYQSTSVKPISVFASSSIF